MKNPVLIAAIFFLTIACGNSGKSDKTLNSTEITSTTTESTSARINSPCDILTEEEIKSVLDVPSDAETTMNEKSTTYPICIYKWESYTFPYKMKMGGTEKTVDYPAELNIVLVSNVSEKEYQKSIGVYDDGENVDGVGEMAIWSDKKNQITFLSNGYLMHINTRVSPDVEINKQKATKIAEMIDERI